MSFVWSQTAVDLLQRFYMQQGLSASETAAALGRALPAAPTRNAVLGKVQRLGWARPAAEAAPETARPFAPAARRGPVRRPKPLEASLPPLREIPLAAPPKPWLQRKDAECAYPIGEPEAPGLQLCCGAPTGGPAYCPPHRALMLQPGTGLTEQDREAILFIARRAA